ncbi:anti-sigma factor family protein [Caldilinea sp.]|uniref:anti-sigma factor family protein n=1 Tax=Caldilinea sp. TaxID=2293560 RepID=UPI0026266EF3|nr:zf-HC2 domain-containing protein [uncultured Caldilinea sp.]
MRPGFFHLSYEQLVDWVEGRLSAEQQAAIQSHLNACARCRKQAARIERMTAVMRSDAGVDAPPELITRAVKLFQRRASEPTPGLLQRWVATLSFESRTLAPAFGLRSQSVAELQQIYNADGFDIDLRIAPDATAWTVSGQVLGVEKAEVAGVATLVGGELTLHASLSDDLFFRFVGVQSGRYTLIVRLGAVELVVEDLVVGESG